jgi:hypothetical protein
MFKLTELMSNYLGSSYNILGASSNAFMNMMSTLYENESRMSSIGGVLKRSDGMNMTCYNFPIQVGRSALLSSIGDKPHIYQKDTLSEVNKINNFSHLSVAGSDDYREELIKNDDYLEEFEDLSNQSPNGE